MTLAELAGLMNTHGSTLGGDTLVCLNKVDGLGPFEDIAAVKVVDMVEMLETIKRPASPGFTPMNVVKGELYFPGEWCEQFAAGKYRPVKIIVIE